MSDKSDDISNNLLAQYNDLLPLLSYLKTRVKYDTVRWIRTFGAKDDLIFSTRIKSFERTFAKIARKRTDLSRNTNLLDLILSGKRLLDDMVGIRFVCFDPHQIVRLVSHFLTTQQAQISHPEFYMSSKSDAANPIHEFLLAAGFSPQVKSGREYEDVSFVFRFRHPIDLYYDSGKIPYSSPHAKKHSPGKLNRLNKFTEQAPQFIGVITEFPIEAQIVTATQHIYNRMQRPLYEHVIQKEGEPSKLYADIGAIEENLKILKMNLMIADQSALSIHTKLGARFDFVPRVNSALQFGIEGRLPTDLMSINRFLHQINDELLPNIFSADTNKKRVDALGAIFKLIARINEAIHKRAREKNDIADRNLLNLHDLPDLSHPNIFFWSIQRIVLLVASNILLFSNSDAVNTTLLEIINAQQASTGDEEGRKTNLVGERLALERIFEKLKHTDNAVVGLLRQPQRIKKWQEGYFASDIFLDPVVLWRYATFMYKNREYRGALQEIEVGLEIWSAREAGKPGKLADSELPEKVLFRRRRVEYQLCHEMSQLRYSSVSVAGSLEMCHLVTARSSAWIAELSDVRGTTRHTTEQARAFCYELLIRLCVVSAGGLKAGRSLTVELGDYVAKFSEMERNIKQDSIIKLKTWWLLCEAATNPRDAQEPLQRFDRRIKTVKQHPQEKNHFEQLCGRLIRLWLEGQPEARGFAVNAMQAVTLEIESLRAVAKVEAEVQVIREMLAEVLAATREGAPISDTTKDKWRSKLANIAIEGAEKIIVDTAVAGLRNLLGF